MFGSSEPTPSEWVSSASVDSGHDAICSGGALFSGAERDGRSVSPSVRGIRCRESGLRTPAQGAARAPSPSCVNSSGRRRKNFVSLVCVCICRLTALFLALNGASRLGRRGGSGHRVSWLSAAFEHSSSTRLILYVFGASFIFRLANYR